MDSELVALEDSIAALDGKIIAVVGPHYRIIGACAVMAVIILIAYLGGWLDPFRPIAWARIQTRASSAFAQQVQGTHSSFTYDPNATADQANSLAYQVLHSKDFACDTRTTVGDDAWSWMNGVVKESMSGAGTKTDNDFSRVLSGQ